MNNGIQIIYPRSKYLTLNQAMLEFLENMICEFMNYAKGPIQENFTYTLDISHDEYSFQDYLSVVFYVSFYTGGAHPEHRIVSLVYDISKDQMITMQDLVSEKENLLSILSEESRRILSSNPKITDSKLLVTGTSPDISNYQIFAFVPTGIMIYFPEYQIAPYSSGAFKIVIPYAKIFEQ